MNELVDSNRSPLNIPWVRSTPTRRVKGRLVFAHNANGAPKPVHNAWLQLWDLDLIENDYLAQGRTDSDGHFEFEYDPDKGNRWGDEPDLVLRLLVREHSYDRDGNPVSDWQVAASFHGGNDISDDLFDFGTLRVALWEYESPEDLKKVAFTPRVAVIDGKTPQGQRHGRTMAQLNTGARYAATHAKNALIAKFSDEHPNPSEIEAGYPQSRTREMAEEAYSDFTICDLVLNGFNPCILKTTATPGEYYVDFRWDGLAQDGRHFAPNTTAYFQLDDEGLSLQSIAVQKRVGGDDSAHARYRQPKLYRPSDPEWGRVKRLFRCNYFLFGEVYTHLAETHLNVEQYIVPMRRNLFQNPIARLLFPHFYGTTAVNLAANEILLSDKGIIQKCSALTASSVEYATRVHFGTLNWLNWKPRQPLCAQHRFAKIGQLYWQVIQDYVEMFFRQNNAAIQNEWQEIRRMSDELVAHALPFVRSQEEAYYDLGEVNTAAKPHPLVAGVPVALSPVTTSDEPDANGMRNLAQLCCYLLFHATFKHSWINDLQYDMGSDIEFSTLGVTDDITNMRVPTDAVVPPNEAIEHPFITYVLTFTEYGYILRNEDNDMNPDLIRALMARRDDFAALDYDIRQIRSCINT